MIKSLRLKNFQSWKKMKIEFEPFTVIVGPSDVGKSAAIRALGAFVSPFVGLDYVRSEETELEVEVELDSCTLAYVKGEGVNKYVLSVEGEEPVVFSKTGRQFPEELKEYIDITSEKFKQETINLNIDGQFDPPFLLFTPGSTVAQVIGSVLNLDLIFMASHLLAKDLGKKKQEIQFNAEQIARFTEDLEDLSSKLDVDEMHEVLDRLDVLIVGRDSLYDDIRVLNDVQVELQSLLSRPLPSVDPKVSEELDELLAKAKVELSDLLSLQSLVVQVPSGGEEFDPGIDLDALVAAFEEAQGVESKLVESQRLVDSVSEEILEAKTLDNGLYDSRKELSSCEEDRFELIDALDVCPLSFVPLPAKCKEALNEVHSG